MSCQENILSDVASICFFRVWMNLTNHPRTTPTCADWRINRELFWNFFSNQSSVLIFIQSWSLVGFNELFPCFLFHIGHSVDHDARVIYDSWIGMPCAVACKLYFFVKNLEWSWKILKNPGTYRIVSWKIRKKNSDTLLSNFLVWILEFSGRNPDFLHNNHPLSWGLR